MITSFIRSEAKKTESQKKKEIIKLTKKSKWTNGQMSDFQLS